MYFVLNEPIRTVHFAAGLPVWTLECVLALDSCTASDIANGAVHASRYFRSLQPREKAKFTGINRASIVRRHVNCRLLWLRNVIMSDWQTIRLNCDLHIAVDVLGSYRGRAQTGVDTGGFASTLILDAFVVEAGEIAIRSTRTLAGA
jgi:hypothetical protein